MKLSIEGTQEEIQKTLQAICGSEERENIHLYKKTDQLFISVVTNELGGTLLINDGKSIKSYFLNRE